MIPAGEAAHFTRDSPSTSQTATLLPDPSKGAKGGEWFAADDPPEPATPSAAAEGGGGGTKAAAGRRARKEQEVSISTYSHASSMAEGRSRIFGGQFPLSAVSFPAMTMTQDTIACRHSFSSSSPSHRRPSFAFGETVSRLSQAGMEVQQGYFPIPGKPVADSAATADRHTPQPESAQRKDSTASASSDSAVHAVVAASLPPPVTPVRRDRSRFLPITTSFRSPIPSPDLTPIASVLTNPSEAPHSPLMMYGSVANASPPPTSPSALNIPIGPIAPQD